MEGKDELPAEDKHSKRARHVLEDFAARQQLQGGDGRRRERALTKVRLRHRPARIARGFSDVGGGWLLPRIDDTDDDVRAWELRATFATILTLSARAASNRLPAEDAERNQLLRAALFRAREAWFRGHPSDAPDEWWVGPLRFHLRVEACTPARHRRTIAALVADALRMVPTKAPRPPDGIEAVLRKLAGERCERLAAGHGGGANKKRSAEAIAEGVRVTLRTASAQAAYRAAVLRAVRDHRGISGARVRELVGGNEAHVRRALAGLERDRKIVNEGTAAKQAFSLA